MLDQLAHVLAVRGGDRQRLAEPELVELGGARARAACPSALLTASTTGRPDLRSSVGDRRVLRRQPVAAVDDEHDDVGLGDRLRRLLAPSRAGCPSVATGSKPPVSTTRYGRSPTRARP